MPLTGAAALGGFLLSLVCGTLLGLVFSQSKIIQRSIYPVCDLSANRADRGRGPVDHPVVRLRLSGGGGRIVHPEPVSDHHQRHGGLTQVDPNLLELFAVHNASRWQVLLKLRLPNAVPLPGHGGQDFLRAGRHRGHRGRDLCRLSGGAFRPGTLITRANGNLDTSYVFAGVICSTLLSIAIFATVSLLGATILARWHVRPSAARPLIE